MNESEREMIRRTFRQLKYEVEDAFASMIDEPWGKSGRCDWMPAVDVDESDDKYVVTVDLPGLCKADVELHVRPYEVELRGERSAAYSVSTGRRIRTERIIGRFRRRFSLDREVDPQSCTAQCRDGVYRLEIRKRSAEHHDHKGKAESDELENQR